MLLTKLPFRAQFSNSDVIGAQASVFTVPNLKKEWNVPMNSFNKILSLALLVTVYLTVPHLAKADSAALNRLGICDHLVNYSASDSSAACDEIIASGIKFVRADASWDWLMTTQSTPPTPGGVPNAARLAQLDDMVNRLSAAGVQLDLVLLTTARWATSPPLTGDKLARPANWQDWADFVHYITTRYKGKVTYWEVGNEPDHGGWHGTVQEYVTWLQTASVQIRATDSNNKILMGGLACFGTPATGGFFDTELALGAANYFDIINYHSYDTHLTQRNTFAGIQALINKYGLQSRPIWITETGYSTSGDATLELAKAQYLEATYYDFFAFSPNIQKVFLYVQRNTNIGNIFEDNFGFLSNANRTPLLPFYHYQAIDGAETNFAMQKAYPSTEYRRTLNYVVTTTGDGKYITDYVPDGSSKRILANTYMYFQIDSWWLNNVPSVGSRLYIDVTYLDSGTGNWGLQYSGASNAYTTIQSARTNTGTWKTQRFTLPDAKFANNENYTSDFRLYSPTSDLMVQTVVVRQSTTLGWAALGVTDPIDQSWLIWRPQTTNPAASSYNPVATIGGSVCRQIIDNGHYIYFDVADQLVPPSQTNVTIKVTYWDAGTDKILISYDAIGNAYKSHYFTKTNTNTWKTYSAVITDANFVDGVSNIADFRIGNAGDGSVEYVSAVTVSSP